MFTRQRVLARRHHAEAGATAVEYGLLVAMLAGAVVAVVATLGGGVREGFNDVIDGFGATKTTVRTPADCQPLPETASLQARRNWEGRCGSTAD